MKIEAASRAVDVHQFACEEKARNAFAFHSLRIDFMEGDAADSDDGLFQRTYFRNVQRHPLQKWCRIVMRRGFREDVAEGWRDVQFIKSVGE